MPATTEIEVSVQFTRNGIPATDLEIVTPGFPTLRIWDITQGAKSLTLDATTLSSVTDGLNDDGFYMHIFTNAEGFDETKKYVCAFDGGSSIPDCERYSSGYIIPNYQNEILDKLDEITDETDENSIESKINTILLITDYLRKFETNRTYIDTKNAELIVYDDDCKTVLWKFKLLDCVGKPGVEEIAERLPIQGGSGLWDVCPTP